MSPGCFDLAQAVYLQGVGVAPQQVGHAEDGVHRGAQFMAHGCQEGTLGPVCSLRGIACLFEFCGARGHQALEVQAMRRELFLDGPARGDVVVQAAQPYRLAARIKHGCPGAETDHLGSIFAVENVFDIGESPADELEVGGGCRRPLGGHELEGTAPKHLLLTEAQGAFYGGRDEGVAAFGVHFPDPVGRDLGDAAEALLRGAQRFLGGFLVAQVREHQHDVVEAAVFVAGATGVELGRQIAAVVAPQRGSDRVVSNVAVQQATMKIQLLCGIRGPGIPEPLIPLYLLPAIAAHRQQPRVGLDQGAIGRHGSHSQQRALEVSAPVPLAAAQLRIALRTQRLRAVKLPAGAFEPAEQVVRLRVAARAKGRRELTATDAGDTFLQHAERGAQHAYRTPVGDAE